MTTATPPPPPPPAGSGGGSSSSSNRHENDAAPPPLRRALVARLPGVPRTGGCACQGLGPGVGLGDLEAGRAPDACQSVLCRSCLWVFPFAFPLVSCECEFDSCCWILCVGFGARLCVCACLTLGKDNPHIGIECCDDVCSHVAPRFPPPCASIITNILAPYSEYDSSIKYLQHASRKLRHDCEEARNQRREETSTNDPISIFYFLESTATYTQGLRVPVWLAEFRSWLCVAVP